MITHPVSADAEALASQAGQVLRTLALDEELKWRIPQDPVLGRLARKVAERFVAGETLTDALERIVSGQTKSHELHNLLPWNWRPIKADSLDKLAA